MKTLYESILDDEDILISKTKKTSQNWLLIVKNMLEQNYSAEDILKFLNSKIVTDSIKPMFKKFENMQWKYGKNDIFSYCMLFDKKERKKYGPKDVIQFIYYYDERFATITGVVVDIPKFDDLPATTRNNIITDEYYKWLSTLFNEYGLYKTKMKDVYKI
jgi:hypothetical protein